MDKELLTAARYVLDEADASELRTPALLHLRLAVQDLDLARLAEQNLELKRLLAEASAEVAELRRCWADDVAQLHAVASRSEGRAAQHKRWARRWKRAAKDQRREFRAAGELYADLKNQAAEVAKHRDALLLEVAKRDLAKPLIEAPTARVVLPGAAPRPLDPCPHCGKVDFKTPQGRGGHLARCEKNPRNQGTVVATAEPEPARVLPHTLDQDGYYVCPACNRDAFAQAIGRDVCVRCDQEARRAA